MAQHVSYCVQAAGKVTLTHRDMGTRGAKQRGLEAPPDDISKTVRE